MSNIVDPKPTFTENSLPVKSTLTQNPNPVTTPVQDPNPNPVTTPVQDPNPNPNPNPNVPPQITIINVTLLPTPFSTTQAQLPIPTSSPQVHIPDQVQVNNTGLILGIIFGISFLFLALFLLLFFIKKKRKKIDTLPAFLEPRSEPINENIPSSIAILQDPNVSYTINDGLGYNIAYNSMGEPMYATNQF
jgi:hypothetical protein